MVGVDGFKLSICLESRVVLKLVVLNISRGWFVVVAIAILTINLPLDFLRWDLERVFISKQ